MRMTSSTRRPRFVSSLPKKISRQNVMFSCSMKSVLVSTHGASPSIVPFPWHGPYSTQSPYPILSASSLCIRASSQAGMPAFAVSSTI